jgi:hypothetical protein
LQTSGASSAAKKLARRVPVKKEPPAEVVSADEGEDEDYQDEEFEGSEEEGHNSGSGCEEGGHGVWQALWCEICEKMSGQEPPLAFFLFTHIVICLLVL